MSWQRVPGPAWKRVGGGRRQLISPTEDYCKAMTVACPSCHAVPTQSCIGMENEPNNFHLVRLDAWMEKWAP